MKMEFRKKTTATLLIALFMISTLAVAMPISADPVRLRAEGAPGAEDGIVIPMPEGFTLGELMTISWSVFTYSGYPLHVDIIIENDIDNDPLTIDSLTAEIGENDNPDNREWLGDLEKDYTYDEWLKTFEYADTVGDYVVDDETILWVTRHGAGCDDAPYGTLAEMKDGIVHPGPEGDPTIIINENSVVLSLEFEVDYWPMRDGVDVFSEADIDNIQVNDLSVDLLLEVLSPPIVSIMVEPTSVNFGALRPGEAAETKVVTIYNIGDVAVTVGYAIEGELFQGLAVSEPGTIDPGYSSISSLDLTVPSGALAGSYTGKLVFEATAVPP